jgi:hypothetical protein
MDDFTIGCAQFYFPTDRLTAPDLASAPRKAQWYLPGCHQWQPFFYSIIHPISFCPQLDFIHSVTKPRQEVTSATTPEGSFSRSRENGDM